MKTNDYITIIISMFGCITGILSLLITTIRYKHEKPSAKIIDIDFDRYMEFDKEKNANGGFIADISVFIIAKI